MLRLRTRVRRSDGVSGVAVSLRGGGVAARHPAAGSFATAEVSVGGATLVADPAGVLFWPDENLLMVADLHLEKGSSQARRGILLPPYDTSVTLARLGRAVARYRPTRVVALGDSLHDRHGASRLSAQDRSTLAALMTGRDWVWITGNHDPVTAPSPVGMVVQQLIVRGITLRHEPSEGPEPEIAGHLHPAARLARRGTKVRRPCFVGDGARLIVPAFGAYTGGLNVLAPAFRSHFQDRAALAVWMLGSDSIYRVPIKSLHPDG
jgi:uncharacterized protein